MIKPHILVVTFPLQSHVNPAIQFCKRLLSLALDVTFAIPIGFRRQILNANFPTGLSLATFSDGYEDGYNLLADDVGHYVSQLSLIAPQTFPPIILENANKGHPFTCIIYSLLLPWVAKVARDFHLPSIFLWNQPAIVFDIYYYYFHGYANEIEKLVSENDDSSYVLNLPGLPPLGKYDVPSFFLPKHSQKHSFALQKLKDHFDGIDEQTKPPILVNTFEDLEASALKSITNYNLIGIDPLIPSAFLNEKDQSDRSFGVDLRKESKGYIEWLDMKPESSVIYVSFGSTSVLSEAQIEEVGKALIEIDCPFLWVTRGLLRRKEVLEEKGMMVEWCNQVEVLSHKSIRCFMTHCGWNSTVESLSVGVPVVGLPQWSDQLTISKMVQDVWKIGVRLLPNNCEDGIFKCGDIKRCLNMVMADTHQAKQMRKNAKKWKDLARNAVKESGSSHKNLKDFLCEIGQGC